MRKTLKAVFPHTLPVLAGYLFMGAAFGVMLRANGYGPLWALGMSLFIYAGSGQFVGVALLASIFQPLYAFLLILMVNSRHLFYGISFLERYAGTGWKKPFLIFWLTDETFSILCSAEPPPKIDRGWFMFFVNLLNQIYWVSAATAGALLGYVVQFDTTGIDFVMTALFVVMFLNQWEEAKDHRPALVGLICSAVCLLIFGSSNFIVPSMIFIIVCFTAERKLSKKPEVAAK